MSFGKMRFFRLGVVCFLRFIPLALFGVALLELVGCPVRGPVWLAGAVLVEAHARGSRWMFLSSLLFPSL